MSNATAVTDQTFDTEVLAEKGTVVVDFWAEWCGPCKLIAPVLEELASEYDGKIKVRKLNIDENPGTSAKFGILSIPTLLFFRNGERVDQIVGAASKADLRKKIEAAI